MFADPSRLDPESLLATAVRLGLDRERFESCFTEQRPRPILDAELKAAKQWAIDGTPGLFLNGRFVSGARSFGYWKALVEDELARLAP
jgi:predicted DsbA family dithiol-disulfide isomerase